MNSRILSVILLGLSFLSLNAQSQTMLWPIAGQTAGENILSQPQNYIGEELNFYELFIGAEPGTFIICPADGVIISLGAVYCTSLTYSLAAREQETLSLKENVLAARQADNLQYTGALSIRLADGNKLHMQGFLSDQRFKTGQKLSKGDTLGVVDYSYKAFREPSLMVSISNRENRPTDPMTPFGLKTTFKEPEAFTRDNPLPAEKIREDLTILEDAYCELYPSLEDRMGETAFRAFMDSVKTSVTEPMDVPLYFRILLRKVLHQLPDSHVSLFPDPIQTTPPVKWAPCDFMLFCDDTLRVLLTTPYWKQHEGKVVTSVNGMPAADYAKQAYELMNTYDDGVQSTREEDCVTLTSYWMLMHPDASKGTVHAFEFADGSSARIPFDQQPRFMATDSYRRLANWHNVNRMESDDDVFQTRMLNDSTAYLGIKTFEMLSGQVDEVRSFLGSLKTPNLIIDVRNNAGGHNDVLMNLLSCLATEPMERQKGGYAKVNKQGKFASLAHSMNYTADSDIFPDFEPGEGGFYLKDTIETCSVVMPDSVVHYGGKVYVLTNGSSFSAATLFPAVLVRNRRGVSVGRETGTGYHYMTALKFADIMLPNSLQTIRIPLVKLVFDETVCERLPEGRGLLPDYPVPLTYNEVMCGTDGATDVILDYALSLIAQGKYLSAENPFAAFDKEASQRNLNPIFLIGLLAISLLALAVALFARRKR